MIKKFLSIFVSYLSRLNYSYEELVRQRGGFIGKDVFIGQDVYIDLDYAFLLEIGDGAVISAKSIIELHDSSLPNVMGTGKLKVGRVRIGQRSYIGANSVVLPGVRIGDGAIVGAASLVNTNIPPHEVWAGVPAKYICTVAELIQKRETMNNTDESANFEWIGQPEKQGGDYERLKEGFLSEVKRYFIK
jgi:maltose O-acetyltransferase